MVEDADGGTKEKVCRDSSEAPRKTHNAPRNSRVADGEKIDDKFSRGEVSSYLAKAKNTAEGQGKKRRTKKEAKECRSGHSLRLAR